ncbi:hypothetical protein EDF56_11527 [Novosphingobium sp. PhB165]|nr:hypothetical protein EDF56_11527 [Novosphingobium sp. PhB165]
MRFALKRCMQTPLRRVLHFFPCLRHRTPVSLKEHSHFERFGEYWSHQFRLKCLGLCHRQAGMKAERMAGPATAVGRRRRSVYDYFLGRLQNQARVIGSPAKVRRGCRDRRAGLVPAWPVRVMRAVGSCILTPAFHGRFMGAARLLEAGRKPGPRLARSFAPLGNLVSDPLALGLELSQFLGERLVVSLKLGFERIEGGAARPRGSWAFAVYCGRPAGGSRAGCSRWLL